MLITLILGIAPIIIEYYKSRKPKLFFLRKLKVSLNEDIVRKIDGIEIKYKSELIKNNLHLISGIIYFQSNKDIGIDEVYRPISLNISSGEGVWKSFTFDHSPLDSHPGFSIENNKIIFAKSPLFQDDYFAFTGLIDSPDSHVHVTHKILNVAAQVDNVNIADFHQSKKDIFLFFPLLLLLLLFFYFTIYNSRQFKIMMNISEFKNSTITPTFDLEPIYKINNRVINLDSLISNEMRSDSIKLAQNSKKNKRQIDSLKLIVSNDPSNENKLVLQKKVNDHLIETFSDNTIPYRKIEVSSRNNLEELKNDSSFKLHHFYKVNDSVQVAYKYSRNISSVTYTEYFIVFFILILILVIYYLLFKSVKIYFKYAAIVKKIGMK